MDLDFKSVKALASPTRLEIINEVLEKEATTTGLADDLGKSKSTVSSHLKVLTESGLLEKDEEDGRRRVVYRPTDKARAIANGKEKKVKFSVVSSALTGFTGLFVLSRPLYSRLTSASGGVMGAMDTGQMAVQSMDGATETASTSQGLPVEQALIVLGAGLIVTAVIALGYGYMINKIR